LGISWAHAERLFSLVQKRAQELVEEIAALPPLPKQIYEMGDAASELAKHREHRSTWASSPARIRISCSPVTSATCAATRSMKVSPACRTARRESPSSSGIDGRGCPVPASGGLNQRSESDTALTKAGSPDCGESGTLRRARRTALSASLRIWAPPSASPGHHKVSVLAAMGQALRSSIFTNTEQKGASVSVGEEAGHLLQRASGSGERSGLAILEAVRKVTELNSVAHVPRHLVRAVGPCEPQSSPPSGNSCPKSGARAGRSRPICLDYLPEDNGLVSFSRGSACTWLEPSPQRAMLPHLGVRRARHVVPAFECCDTQMCLRQLCPVPCRSRTWQLQPHQQSRQPARVWGARKQVATPHD